MRSPRSLLALPAAIVLALGAAACGDDDALDDDAGTTTTTEVPADDGGTDGDGTGDAGTDDGGTAGPEAPEGWQVVEGDGVSIAAPADWRGLPLDVVAVSGEDLQEVLPDADEALLGQVEQVVRQGGVLLAFGPTVDGFTDNVNVLAMPVAATLEQLEREAELGMGQLGAEVGSIELVELPIGEAVRVRYTLVGQGSDGPVTIEGVQFYVPQEDTTYVMTVSTRTDPAAVADGMAASLRVG